MPLPFKAMPYCYPLLLCLTWLTAISALSFSPRRSNHHAKSTRKEYEPHLRAKIAHSVAKGERRANERQAQPRHVCEKCCRPPLVCVCDALAETLIDTATQILILQHTNEFRKRNLSTVPLMRLVLKNINVKVGYTFEWQQLEPVVQALENGVTPLLLYPGPNATTLDAQHDVGSRDSCLDELIQQRLEHNNNINKSNRLLILVDGTWTEAKRMVRDSPGLLENCLQVQFAFPGETSIYNQVRREPHESCLSTLEACAKALSILEPSSKHDAIETLQQVLRSHVKSHLYNSKTLEPRHVGVAFERKYEKNKRRREIELQMFDGAKRRRRRVLQDGAILRSLQLEDAPMVDSWWEYQSPKSLSLVSRRIDLDGGVACLGIECDKELVACILRYEGGALGMLHVKEECRRRGYATILLEEASRALEERGEERVAFIVDGNVASEALFAKLGWKQADLNVKKQTGKRRAKRKWIKR